MSFELCRPATPHGTSISLRIQPIIPDPEANHSAENQAVRLSSIFPRTDVSSSVNTVPQDYKLLKFTYFAPQLC